jgi:hypothetical protein
MFNYDQVPLIPTEDLATYFHGSLARMKGRRRIHCKPCDVSTKEKESHLLLFLLYMHKPTFLTKNETKRQPAICRAKSLYLLQTLCLA